MPRKSSQRVAPATAPAASPEPAVRPAAAPAPTAGTTAPPAKKKRGRETPGDMIRSLGLVMLLVLLIFFLGRPSSRDEAPVRVVDPSSDVAAFSGQAPGAPVPGRTPEDWQPTSSTLAGDPEVLRIGYLLPGERYAEYAGVLSTDPEVVSGLTGTTSQGEPVDIDGVAWQRYRDEDGSLSLVRAAGQVTVVVGTTRATADESALRTLVGALSTG